MRIGSLFFASRMRANVKATSFAVNGSPLWNVALSTRSKSHVLSSSCFHDFARPGTNWPALVHVDELVVDVLVDLERRVELGVARIHVHGLVDGGDAEHAAALGLPLRRREPDAGFPDERAEPRSDREPARPMEPLTPRDRLAHRPFLPKSSLVGHSILHDQAHAPHRLDVLQRVAVDRDQIGALARHRASRSGRRPDTPRRPSACRPAARRAATRRSGRASRARSASARACCRCRTRSGCRRPGGAGSSRPATPPSPAHLVHDGRTLAVALLDAGRVHEDRERADEPHAALDHQRDVLVAGQEPVLDRAHALLDREAQPGARRARGPRRRCRPGAPPRRRPESPRACRRSRSTWRRAS